MVRLNESGNVASYIPQLAKVPPNKFGVSICTVDGQTFSIGDVNDSFCIQSCSKPVTYGLALEAHGQDTCVRAWVGWIGAPVMVCLSGDPRCGGS